MRWYRADVGLSRHRKTARLADELGCTIIEAVGLLHLFWEHVAEQYETGDITEMGDAELSRICISKHDPAAFRAALLASNFIDSLPSRGKDPTRNRLVVHGWNERNAKVLRDRRRMRTVRERSRDGSHYPPYPPTLPTIPTQPTDEPPLLAPVVEGKASNNSIPEPIRGLKLFENDPDLLKRWSELWARWKKSFPDVDLEREILAAHEHQMEAPPAKRRKSKARFLGNWFRRSAEFAKRDAARDADNFRGGRSHEEKDGGRLTPGERDVYEKAARAKERRLAKEAEGESNGS